MEQKLDELRTLSVKLYEAGQVEKRKQPFEIWGEDCNRKFRDLPSESVAVWDAVALAAIALTEKQNQELQLEMCDECNGEGQKMVCIDDLCQGQGWCIHGDGYILCPICKGDGEI